jgi:hypothetical protein
MAWCSVKRKKHRDFTFTNALKECISDTWKINNFSWGRFYPWVDTVPLIVRFSSEPKRSDEVTQRCMTSRITTSGTVLFVCLELFVPHMTLRDTWLSSRNKMYRNVFVGVSRVSAVLTHYISLNGSLFSETCLTLCWAIQAGQGSFMLSYKVVPKPK